MTFLVIPSRKVYVTPTVCHNQNRSVALTEMTKYDFWPEVEPDVAQARGNLECNVMGITEPFILIWGAWGSLLEDWKEDGGTVIKLQPVQTGVIYVCGQQRCGDGAEARAELLA